MSEAASKVCSKCKQEKPLDEFPRCPSQPLGRHRYCKVCKSAHAKVSYARHRATTVEHVREYKESHREECAAYTRQYQEEHPDAWRDRHAREKGSQVAKARANLNYHASAGNIQKPNTCSMCGRVLPTHKIHGHHPDYSKQLEVVWVCNRCHGLLHRIELS